MIPPIDPTELPMHRWTRERLSAFVDDDLTPGERHQVEAHLAVCESCGRELATLRQTINWLQQLPIRPAPRSFVVSGRPTHTAGGRLAWLFPYLNAAGALAAILLVIVLAADWLQTSGAVRLGAAPTSRQVGIGAAPPLADGLRLPGSGALPQTKAAAPEATRPEPRGRLDQALDAAAVPTAEPGWPMPSQDKVEARAEKTAKTAASAPSSPLAESLPSDESSSAPGSPPAAAGARTAPVAPLARKPGKGTTGEQAQVDFGLGGAQIAPAAPQMAAPPAPASPLEFAAPAPPAATPVVTPTASGEMARPVAPTASPTSPPALSEQPNLPALTPTMTAPALVSSTVAVVVQPVTAGAPPTGPSAPWVWRILEAGLLLAAAASLTGAWWVKRQR